MKRHVEAHRLIVPMVFTYLVHSMAELTYDDRGNIRKHNDHSHDSLMYPMSEYSIDDFGGFYGEVKDRDITKIW